MVGTSQMRNNNSLAKHHRKKKEGGGKGKGKVCILVQEKNPWSFFQSLFPICDLSDTIIIIFCFFFPLSIFLQGIIIDFFFKKEYISLPSVIPFLLHHLPAQPLQLKSQRNSNEEKIREEKGNKKQASKEGRHIHSIT